MEHNSTLINLNVLKVCSEFGIEKVLYTSSACVYPEYNQMDENNPSCVEDSVYPVNQIQNMVGKSYMPKDCIYHLEKIMESIRRLQDYIISLPNGNI